MTEVPREENNDNESFNGLADKAGAFYSLTLKDYNLHSAFLDARYSWDKNLKARCIEKYGTTKMLQKVPAWQRLVGGSVEEEDEITPEQKTYINQEVAKFIKDFTEDNNISNLN